MPVKLIGLADVRAWLCPAGGRCGGVRVVRVSHKGAVASARDHLLCAGDL